MVGRTMINLLLLVIVSMSAEASMTSVLSSMEPEKSVTLEKKQTSSQKAAVSDQTPQVFKKAKKNSKSEADKWTAEYNKKGFISTTSKGA